jgi:hypothetical protein
MISIPDSALYLARLALHRLFPVCRLAEDIEAMLMAMAENTTRNIILTIRTNPLSFWYGFKRSSCPDKGNSDSILHNSRKCIKEGKGALWTVMFVCTLWIIRFPTLVYIHDSNNASLQKPPLYLKRFLSSGDIE